MTRTLLCYIFTIFLFINNTSAEIINIPEDQPTIQDGINSAENGDTVLVQPGIYYENINFNGKNISVASLFLIDIDKNHIKNTIIDGGQKNRVVEITEGDSTTLLSGFTIINGKTTGWRYIDECGGGIACIRSEPTLSSLIITNNYASSVGGGIYCYKADPILNDVKIYDNSTKGVGGGFGLRWSNPILSNVSIYNNFAISNTGTGGGIFIYDSHPVFDSKRKCNIYQNKARLSAEDIYSNTKVDVFVDTFTVVNPTGLFACPLSKINISPLNGILSQKESDLFVDPNGSDNNSGLTQNDPLQTINQAAKIIFADSLNPRKIYLNEGVYSPSTNNEIFPIKCPGYISIVGTKDTKNQHVTFVDAENSHIIFYINGVSGVELKRLVVQSAGAVTAFGAIYCNLSDLYLKDVILRNNISGSRGGAVYVSYSIVNIENSRLYNNSSPWGGGGGIYTHASELHLQNVKLNKNFCNGTGAGMCLSKSQAFFDSVSIYENYITKMAYTNYGGGIYSYDSDMYFNKNARSNIYLNEAGTSTGFDVYSTKPATIYLDTFTVIQPTDLYASPIENFNIDMLTAYTYNRVKTLNVPTSEYPTIQSAIDAAEDSDTVLVQPGIYKENLDIKGKNIVLGSLYIKNNAPVFIDDTIIDGDGKWSIVVFNKAENARCELNGFTLRNGIGVEHNASERHGGAIYCWKSFPTLKNLIIDNNSSTRGSGIYCSRANTNIENVIIKNNSGNMGALHYSESDIDLMNVSIINNSDSGLNINVCGASQISKSTISNNNGYGIRIHASGTTNINGTIISDNNGWAIWTNSSVTIDKSTLVNNSSGISNGEAGVRIKNSILWNKSGTEVSMYVIMSGNAGTSIKYSDVKGGRTSIKGLSDQTTLNYDDETNIETDPLFCDPENGIYTLMDDSPCINTGESGQNMGALGSGCLVVSNFQPPQFSTHAVSGDSIILYWESEINEEFIGYNIYCGNGEESFFLVKSIADRFCSSATFFITELAEKINAESKFNFRISKYDSSGVESNLSSNYQVQIVDKDQEDIPDRFNLFQNYPNPFNHKTIIPYQLAHASHVKLEIHNVLGQKIRTLVDAPQGAGIHKAAWNGLNEQGEIVSSGVYYYAIKSGDFSQLRKMVFLR